MIRVRERMRRIRIVLPTASAAVTAFAYGHVSPKTISVEVSILTPVLAARPALRLRPTR